MVDVTLSNYIQSASYFKWKKHSCVKTVLVIRKHLLNEINGVFQIAYFATF